MKKWAAISVLVFIAIYCYSTPDRYRQVVEHLIGATDKDYTVIQYVFDNQGSHFQRTEEFYYITRDLKTNKELSKILQRSVETYIETDNEGNDNPIKDIEMNNSVNFDQFKLLQIPYLVGKFGIDIQISNTELTIMDEYHDSPEKYKIVIPIPIDLGKYIHLSYIDTYESYDAFFFVIRYYNDNLDEFTSIFSILMDDYWKLKQNIK